MATPDHTEYANPPRRTLAAGIALGAAIGVGIAIIAAFTLVYLLSAVKVTEPLGMQAFLYLGFEAGFAGAVVGGAIAGLSRLRNTK